MSGLDVKVVPIGEDTVLDMGEAPPPLGPVVMLFPEGPALCHDARSCTAITAERRATGERFIVVASAATVEGANVGLLVQMTPAEARLFAKSMVAAADQCEAPRADANPA